jgi:Asp-tRNA(Asn)/Glu-tRNA(Gln) amidotransferase A subunit family amidase
MTRTLADSELLLEGMSGVAAPASRRPLRRYAVSPRISVLEPDVADGFDRALAALPGQRVEPPPPEARLDVLADFFDLVLTEMLVYHRRFDDRRDGYRPSNRGRLEHAEQRAMTAEEYIALQAGRTDDTNAWCDWLAEHRIDAIVEPTIPIVAPSRGRGYDEVFGDVEDLSLTHYWDWTGFPVVSLPSGVGKHSGLPVSVSLIAAPGTDWDLLDWGAALQEELGTVSPP